MKPRFFAGFFLIPLFVIFFTACNNRDAPQVSFYHWKSIFQPGNAEQEALAENKVNTIYVKYFDVIRDEHIKPVSIIHFKRKPGQNIIPVMFIKNNVFENISTAENDSLVFNVLKLISGINTSIELDPAELQFDCDWTTSTRDSYFYFLSKIKAAEKRAISATIRLHQVKYKERTGIPPADKGVLMYYNIGKINADSMNSIYNRDLADKYLDHLDDYPLWLDLALPIFSWGIQSRNGEVIELLNKMNADDFMSDTMFKREGKNTFVALTSGFKSGYYFKKGDAVKIESVSEAALLEMSEDLCANIKSKPSRVIFYDLDSLNLKRYDEKIFCKICNNFN